MLFPKNTFSSDLVLHSTFFFSFSVFFSPLQYHEWWLAFKKNFFFSFLQSSANSLPSLNGFVQFSVWSQSPISKKHKKKKIDSIGFSRRNHKKLLCLYLYIYTYVCQGIRMHAFIYYIRTHIFTQKIYKCRAQYTGCETYFVL